MIVTSAALRNNLLSALIPNGQRIDRTARARAQQTLPVHRFRRSKDSDVVGIEDEGLGRGSDAIAEADAQRAIDAHAQAADNAFGVLVVAHMPSRPSSSRALSMTAGVISAIERSRA